MIIIVLLFPLLFLSSCSTVSEAPPSSRVYQFKGGYLFNGAGFEKKDFYCVDGLIRFENVAQIDSTIHIENQYVIPPFGEAHNHNLIGEDHDDFAKKYVKDGIFYVKNPNNLPRWKPKNGRIKRVGTVDAVFANGGLTATGGHPNGLVKRNMGLGIFKANEGDGGFVWLVDDLEDLDRKWEAILAGKPDFIKTYLLYSEEYERRKEDSSYFNRKGLNPALLKEIVKRAEAANLTVTTHVETAVDFRHAVQAGVHEINHLPGFRNLDQVPLERFRISREEAEEAARKGIFAVTTLMTDRGNPAVKKLFIDNLSLLKEVKVPIALGSDVYRSNAKAEADFIHSLGIFSNLELLKIWCEATAKAIFPNRAIGYLKNGYEANFLVLSENPIEDFKNTEKITLRVKQGQLISHSE